MGAVLDGGPVAANGGHQGRLIPLREGQTGHVIADFQRRRCFGFMVALGIAFDGNHLPTAGQPNLFGTDGYARQPPPVKAAVFFLPEALRGENPAGRAGVGLYRESRFGCL